MAWSKVKLIFAREVRDQLRDRRTLFMIAVLPILLYPLMGMVILQVSQFRQEEPTRIWLIGANSLPDEPQLIANGTFHPDLCRSDEGRLLELTIDPALPEELSAKGPQKAAHTAIQNRQYDAVVYFPPEFAKELAKYRTKLREHPKSSAVEDAIDHTSRVPQPEVFANTANDKSRIAYDRIERVLHRWKQAVVTKNLEASNVPAAATKPFEVSNIDIAEETSKRAAIWSKILPFVLLVWALTGAFYPAIDLCAGEKERGTLETLLSSPAQRSEIVWGKLLTVMTFSMTTSLLNLCSMAATGSFVFTQMQRMGAPNMSLDLGPPPLASLAWLLVALIPISALFSALSLAIAAFARSSKEGQYYLMPLLLFTMPLMIFPLMPATQLNLGTAIIPVTGVMFLLRTLMEGQYLEAARYAVPVIGVTIGCCLLAVRWAIDQFNNESVLFRESERWDIGLWLRQLVRDRGETPTIGEAILCGVLILIARFFAGFVAPATNTFSGFAIVTLVLQIALIAAPALVMTLMLTSSPRKTLSLRWPRWQTLPIAIALAVLLHPVAMWLSIGIHTLYPLSESAREQIAALTAPLADTPLIYIVLLMAVVPAICEELAFRGFILSGLRHTGHRWAAIAISSLFFGITHSLLQQSISAFCLGMLIGYICIRTGSILPGMLYHVTHNSLAMSAGFMLPKWLEQYPWLNNLVTIEGDGLRYAPAIAIPSGLAAVALLYWLHRQPYHKFAEERLQQALDEQTPLTVANKIQWRFW
ncbi:MAG TPA: ABC transporter permease subunit/CPBP intramembrane protease [Pirellulaceae bacterium]|nr:ABC transporter permease subunit/CPBP intramembrane protease [Pirellulaceae bacterium]